MDGTGILGTSAPLSRDITLLLYILLLAPAMITGFIFARRKMFTPYHKFTMTGITIFNWILIVVIMFVSYRFISSDGLALSSPLDLIATIHLITGGLAQLLATYLVIMMWTERTSLAGIVPFRFKNIKRPMRLTLALWLTTVVLGIGIYLVSYAGPASAETIPPAATEEAPGSESTQEATTESANPESTEAAQPDSTEEASSPAATESANPSSTEEASSGNPYSANPASVSPASTESVRPSSTEEADDDHGGRGRGSDDDDEKDDDDD